MILGIIKILQKFQKFGLFLSNEFQTISEEFLKNFSFFIDIFLTYFPSVINKKRKGGKKKEYTHEDPYY